MKKSEDFYPVALTIAGSDSGGGAGIQADLRTFNAAGVYGCSVITAVTAQNPRQVLDFAAVDTDLVGKQLDAVLDHLAVRAVKTGMLANSEIVKVVAEKLSGRKLPLVVDPVMISTSGTRLLAEDACEVMKNELLNLACLITPNIPEAEWLLGKRLGNEADYADAAMALAKEFKTNCLLKTGHSSGGVQRKAMDFLALDGQLYTVSTPLVTDLSKFATHGTGCSLSSAVAASLAAGFTLKDAVRAAKAYVFGALNEVAHIGRDLDGMYPPLDDYSSQISLRRYQNSGKGEASRKGRRNV